MRYFIVKVGFKEEDDEYVVEVLESRSRGNNLEVVERFWGRVIFSKCLLFKKVFIFFNEISKMVVVNLIEIIKMVVVICIIIWV